MRLSQAEKEKLCSDAKQCGLSKTAYLRRLISGKEVKALPTKELKDLRTEVHKIGNNINQIARKMNAGTMNPQRKMKIMDWGWTDNYFYKVIVHDLYAELIIPQSKHIYFTMNYDHTYSSHPGSAVTFETLGNGYRVKHKNGTIYTFNADGNLTKLEALGGNTVTISYDGDKRTKVENRCGSFTFTYQGEHIAYISDSAGRSISLAYKGDF